MRWIDLGINKVPQDCQKVILGILFWAAVNAALLEMVRRVRDMSRTCLFFRRRV